MQSQACLSFAERGGGRRSQLARAMPSRDGTRQSHRPAAEAPAHSALPARNRAELHRLLYLHQRHSTAPHPININRSHAPKVHRTTPSLVLHKLPQSINYRNHKASKSSNLRTDEQEITPKRTVPRCHTNLIKILKRRKLRITNPNNHRADAC